MNTLAVIYRPSSLRFIVGPLQDLAAKARQTQLLHWATGEGEPWILVGSADSVEAAVKQVKDNLTRLGDSKALPSVVSLELYVSGESAPPKGEAKWN